MKTEQVLEREVKETNWKELYEFFKALEREGNE